jgi:hypothetical protein
MFTVSWDVFLNYTAGTFNVKLPVVAFFFSLVASLLDRRRVAVTREQRAVRAAVIFLILAYVVGVAFATDHRAALAQLVTVLLGALIPFMAVSRVLRLGGNGATLLTAFISGAVVASLFGVYQLVCRYTGLPNPVNYDGVGAGVGRIPAFSYEPAYFGYFLVLAIAAYFAREALTGTTRGRASLAVLVFTLLLANSRAVLFTLPLLAFFLFFHAKYLTTRRLLIVPGLIVAYVLAYATVASEGVRGFLQERLGSIVDAAEPTSNAPRLSSYGEILRLVQDHWLVGVGPGGLFSVGPEYGVGVGIDASPNSVVANNIWLQALSDGGILLAIAHLVLVGTVALKLLRHRLPVSRALAAGWLTVVIVGGMLTSNFYDVKLWVTLGLAVGFSSVVARSGDTSARTGGEPFPTVPRGEARLPEAAATRPLVPN